MSNYPPGVTGGASPGPRERAVCDTCGAVSTVDLYYELGAYFIVDETAQWGCEHVPDDDVDGYVEWYAVDETGRCETCHGDGMVLEEREHDRGILEVAIPCPMSCVESRDLPNAGPNTPANSRGGS